MRGGRPRKGAIGPPDRYDKREDNEDDDAESDAESDDIPLISPPHQFDAWRLFRVFRVFGADFSERSLDFSGFFPRICFF